MAPNVSFIEAISSRYRSYNSENNNNNIGNFKKNGPKQFLLDKMKQNGYSLC